LEFFKNNLILITIIFIVEAKLWQVAETLPEEVLTKMHAPPKIADVPVITSHNLPEADGFLFGIPTRFGIVPAQIKALFDSW
jgi:NAD(P)H dehydrogenase (quinone)